ncbi:MAG: homoserine dehydrogenase [Deltaproteobacteria bacterium]|nr:homoserine dehydrogenase [Deltaproteobacteria bacterium]
MNKRKKDVATVAPLGLRIHLIGFGVVGRGLAKALLRPSTDSGNQPFCVVAVTDRSGTVFNDAGLDLEKLVRAKEKQTSFAKLGTHKSWNGEQALQNIASDIVVEVTPTNIVDGEPGITHIAEALRLGRHVVTANKGPFALQFQRIAALAERSGVALKYGGSVCGAVPIVELVRDALVGNEVLSIRGVMNGSCNYILSRMEQTGEEFDVVLADASKLGITETDPSQDIDGWDAASKLVILANAVMHQPLTIRDVKVQGIRSVTAAMVRDARKRGKALRLIATIKPGLAEVALVELDQHSPLAVTGTLNVAVVETDLAKDISIIGRGAGQMETASAILGDLHAVRREINARSASTGPARKGMALSGLEVGEVAKKKVHTIDEDATLGDAVRVMRKKGISQLPVVREGVCVGTVSERLIMDLLVRRGVKKLEALAIADVMGPPLPEIGARTPLVAVAKVLEQKSAVLVTRGLDIVGIVTRADLLRLVSVD